MFAASVPVCVSNSRRSAYVDDVDTALSMEVISKFSKAREGDLSVRVRATSQRQPVEARCDAQVVRPQVGSDAPDVPVHEYQAPGTDAAEPGTHSLLSFASAGRPLVLTCTPARLRW